MPELRELRLLRKENRRLMGLVADLTLDKAMLQEVLVTPSQRREVAAWGVAAYRVSERRSCRAFGLPLSSVH